MDHASEYNVEGGLLSLGEFIFLELISEMELPQDVHQFLILNKKTYKLILHPRFARIIQSIKGIVRFEVIYKNTVLWRIIGIADASCSFAAGRALWQDGNLEKIVSYVGHLGTLAHKTNGTTGNQKYEDGQRIAVEVDMTTVPRKATFFVENVEQPNFVIGIPEAIRFWAFTFEKSSSFTITKFERLIQSIAKGVEGSKAFEWGKEWK
ncbi:MAG: hypothetical protein EZS28_022156 [Streblomastix strix]|uniref:Uncharacterized protein n=1 Tax=Streblomastix strix TaxID=222440 RepID=A0A5J4VIM2_9EUKA|nr:MAG: hypothetical protein EZS28_022156 [Streblomastix strix]